MFDLAELRAAVAAHGLVARVVIAGHNGSSPRETGAAMLVWQGGQSGTIGGGALEYEACARARTMLADAVGSHDSTAVRVDREALGPKLGQCCGGAVTVLTEIYGVREVEALTGNVIARSFDGRAMPLAVKRLLAKARGQGNIPAPTLVQGWMVEPVSQPLRHLWIWGAGHVGRALADVLAPFPDLSITWIDISADRFPRVVPSCVTIIPASDPSLLIRHAPRTAEHLIVTYSHALDLELCHRLLGHGFARCGLIGSKTKWARFRSRLAALGHSAEKITQIECPIGDPSLGKHPQAIAVGVAARFLQTGSKKMRWEQTQ